MKKTQKILALVMAVLMVASCFGMTVFAEDTEMITVVSVEMISDNEYVVEFSAPITYKYLWSTFRRPSPENGAGQNVKAPSAEYLGDVQEIGGKKYSNLVKITFEDADPAFHLGKHGFVIAEYGKTGEINGDIAGAISPAVLCGINGELVKSNYTNAKGDSDFVWIPTHSLDSSGNYAPHIENTYQDNVEIIGVEVSEDYSTYTLHFTSPVRLGSTFRIWFRPDSPEGSRGQVNPTAVEYIGDTIKFGETDVYSSTVKITIDPNGGTEGGKTLREASADFTKYGISFTEYSAEAGNEGFVNPAVVHGLNGLVLENNYYNARDFYWVPTTKLDTSYKYKAHLNFGTPIALDAVWHAETEEILVTFSEAVSFAEEGAYLCVGGPESETKVALTASATDKDNVIALAVGELPEAFAEGNYGIAFADGFIIDADEKALEANFKGEEANFFYIPTDLADAEDEYPLNLDVHEIVNSEKGETTHWEECECGYIFEETVAEHNYAAKKGNTEGHWDECACGAKTETVAHEFTAVDYDTENHWIECVCDFMQEESLEPHDFAKVDHDDNGHWDECACGATTEAVEHEFVGDYDDETHWTECECGAKTEAVEHEFVGDYDDETHWTECACGAKTEAVEHEFVGDYDDETHWDECACGATTEAVEHEFVGDYDDETHWTECECGATTEPVEHEFDQDGACACGKGTYVLGDVDGNGEVETADAIYLLYYTFYGSERYPLNQSVDFDGNGEVEVADAIHLLYYTFYGPDRYPLA